MRPTTFIMTILLTCILMGCAGVEPYEHNFEPDTNQGPGLITGEKGELEILR
jgi:hypothetical protein